jgi:hypothetical protein
LLYNVTGGGGFHTRGEHVKNATYFMKPIGVFLYHFHWLEPFQLGPFFNAIYSFACIVGQVACIGNVSHITNFIANVREVSIDYIKSRKGAQVAQVYFIVNGRTTRIQAHKGGLIGTKSSFFPLSELVMDTGYCWYRVIVNNRGESTQKSILILKS